MKTLKSDEIREKGYYLYDFDVGLDMIRLLKVKESATHGRSNWVHVEEYMPLPMWLVADTPHPFSVRFQYTNPWLASGYGWSDDFSHDFTAEVCVKCGASRSDVNNAVVDWMCSGWKKNYPKIDTEDIFKPVQVHPPATQEETKCTCGAHKIGSNKHSIWCDWRPEQ